MTNKRCEYCDAVILNGKEMKRFCNPICQRRHYMRRPAIKEKYRLRAIEYRRTHPEWKERHRMLAVTKYREKRREYWKDYGKRPEVRARIRAIERFRLKNDKQYAIADRLRRSFLNALTKYSKTGKIMSSKKYGIDWKLIIEHLKPFPENLNEFEIDHIIPLNSFNLDDNEQIKKAFAPENLQWLTISENRKKSDKIIQEYKKIYKA